ncbi:hypothetical protein [Absidia glauca]|uniref:DNA repair and recombination protein RAD52 n=1 Tax=Absidia glauca TaxID=4829 RepID=A0A168PQ91_ABSGL|nr:hypothetical protein [Absidia glauca]
MKNSTNHLVLNGCVLGLDVSESTAIRSSLSLTPFLILPSPFHVNNKAGGCKLHYIEGKSAINLANNFFGYDGWSSEIKDSVVDFLDINDEGRVSLGISTTVRITLKSSNTVHEDIGYGVAENMTGKAAAFEKARKESATDGLKRALRMLGNAMGNCLYDKTYLRNISNMARPQAAFVPKDLYRQEHVRQSFRKAELATDIPAPSGHPTKGAAGSLHTHHKPSTEAPAEVAAASSSSSARPLKETAVTHHNHHQLATNTPAAVAASPAPASSSSSSARPLKEPVVPPPNHHHQPTIDTPTVAAATMPRTFPTASWTARAKGGHVAPIPNQPPQQPRITKQPARTSAVFPTLASHHPSSSNHPSALFNIAVITMMALTFASTTYAQGAEACIDACFTPHGIKGRCPEGFEETAGRKNCFRCCRRY